MNQKVKKTAMPIFLALLMGLSVIGFSYSPDQTASTSSTQPSSSVTFQGTTFEYVPQSQQYQAEIGGRQLLFYSSPSDVNRLDYPVPAFQGVEEVIIHVPNTAGEQESFIADQMRSDLSNRLNIPVSQGNKVCDDDSRITISVGGEEEFENTEGNCYRTSLTDQSVLLVQDHLVLSQQGLIE